MEPIKRLLLPSMYKVTVGLQTREDSWLPFIGCIQTGWQLLFDASSCEPLCLASGHRGVSREDGGSLSINDSIQRPFGRSTGKARVTSPCNMVVYSASFMREITSSYFQYSTQFSFNSAYLSMMLVI